MHLIPQELHAADAPREGGPQQVAQPKIQLETSHQSAQIKVDAERERTVVEDTQQVIHQTPTDAQMIEKILLRYDKGVAQCGLGSEMDVVLARGKTEDARAEHTRFDTCVCQQARKWRMPKIKQNTRVQHRIAQSLRGYALLVLPTGHIGACQTWLYQPPANGHTP